MRPHVIFRTIDALRAKRLQQTRKHDKRGIEAGQKQGCLREFGKVVLELVRSAFGHETIGTAARNVSQPSTMKFRKPSEDFRGVDPQTLPDLFNFHFEDRASLRSLSRGRRVDLHGLLLRF